MTIARQLAERVLAVRYEELPEEAIEWSEIAFLDTVGVALAGAGEPSVELVRGLPGVGVADGPCLTFDGARRTDPLSAVLINGTASHALDYDDLALSIGGHPSVPLVPAVIALGEMLGASGSQAIAAYVAGFELESRLGRAVNPGHYDKGWHPTVTLGVFGTVAAAARLLGLDAGQTATAFGLAASLASGLKANFGTMTKPLHVGHCGRNGVMAALLAGDGFTAEAGAFEHRQGFFNVFNGEGNTDTERLFDGWAAPLEIVEPGLGLKQFPCCGSTHTAIACMLELRRDHAPSPDQVAAIEVLINPRRLPHAADPEPETGLEAKFSVQYAVARALIDGRVGLSHFEDAAVIEEPVRRLLALTTAAAHPEMAADSDNQFGAEVRITLADGRRLSRRVDHRLGRGPDHPMSGDELWEKFADCAGRVIDAEHARRLFEILKRLRDVDSMTAMTGIIEQGARTDTRAAE